MKLSLLAATALIACASAGFAAERPPPPLSGAEDAMRHVHGTILTVGYARRNAARSTHGWVPAAPNGAGDVAT